MSIYFEWILFVLLVASVIIRLVDFQFFKFKEKERPIVFDYARSLWPVFLIVFLIRSFVFEPYIVPSGSMLPTIQLGDFVLVNKFSYGIHLPLSNRLLIKTGEPALGDIAVFKSPFNPQIDLIKTIVGVPGDRISYIDKQLFINGKAVPQTFMETAVEPNNANLGSPMVQEYSSDIGGHIHTIYTTSALPAENFQNLLVPPGHYFAMGDNRDNSDDSRSWGFVSDNDLIGRATYIFLSYDSNTHSIRWSRIGNRLP